MITHADIAKRAGVSVFTVSCALRNMPRVAASTRAKVKKIAKEMGYQTNPAAKILAGMRHQQKGQEQQMRMTWLIRGAEAEEWKRGITKACRQFGYDLEIIDCDQLKSGAALTRMLWYRGIHGLLLDPSLVSSPAGFFESVDWSRFAAIKFTRFLLEFPFHLVRPSAFDYATMTLKEVFARGYQRVVVLLAKSHSLKDDNARLGAVLSFRENQLPPGANLEWRTCPNTATKEMPSYGPWLGDWVKESNADAVVCFVAPWITALQASGLRVPEDVGFAAILSSHNSWPRPISGCDNDVEGFTYRGVYELHRLLRNHEFGQPDYPAEHVIEPKWIDTDTLPDKRRK